jgi:hypothetical protein
MCLSGASKERPHVSAPIKRSMWARKSRPGKIDVNDVVRFRIV